MEDRFPEIVNYDELRHGVSVTNYTFYSENGGTKEVWSFWSDDEIISHETVEDILKKIGMPVVSDEDFNQEKEALLNEIGLSLLAENAPEPEYKSVTDVFDEHVVSNAMRSLRQNLILYVATTDLYIRNSRNYLMIMLMIFVTVSKWQ